jgi:hypothetical protein
MKINVIYSEWKDVFPQEVYLDALRELGHTVNINNKNMEEYDYIICDTPRSDTIKLIQKALKYPDKLIYVDTADDPFFRKIAKKVGINFKRELFFKELLEKTYNLKPKKYIDSLVWCAVAVPNKNMATSKINTISNLSKYFFNKNHRDIFAIDNEYIESYKKSYPFNLNIKKEVNKKYLNLKKDIDIFISMSNTSPFRKMYIDEIIKISKQNNYKTKIFFGDKELLFYDTYEELLSRSKVSLSVEGVGYDTFRYWEIPAHRTAMLSTDISKFIRIPNNFIDRKEAYFFKNKTELKVALEDLLDNKKWEDIAEKGFKKYNNHHTPLKRIEKVLNIVENVKK